MKTSDNLKKGIFWALFASFISGISIFYNKIFIVSGINILTFNIIKNAGASLILFIILIVSSIKTRRKIIEKKSVPGLILLGFIGGSIPFMLFFEGLRNVSAVNANIIHKSLFLWVALFSVYYLREKLKFFHVLGYFLILFSNFFLGGFSGFKFSVAELMIFSATLFWAAENIIIKKLINRHSESTQYAFGRMFFGAAILLTAAFFMEGLSAVQALSPYQVFGIGISILLLSSYVFSWYKALRYAPATLVTSILVLSTPVTNVLYSLFLGQKMHEAQIQNITLTLIGVFIISSLIPKSSENGYQPSK